MPFPLEEGKVLRERYRIRQIIGQGGMGNIYLADDLRLVGRLCALKEVEYDPSLPPNVLAQAREQFFREASILARLDHPNLPKVSDYFSNEHRDYLVMDYVPGKDLRTVIQEARRQRQFLSEAQVLSWAAQIMDALAYLHGQQPPIIHRDIKPSNIKLMPNGLIKLVDFGLAKVLAPEDVTITVIQGQGTLPYTPLEQYGGEDVHTDVRADIYALGATLYHLLTNEPPADARRRFLEPQSFKSPRSINPAISSRTEQAILWAMALHPDQRPPNIETFRQALLEGRAILSPMTQPRTTSISLSWPGLIFDNEIRIWTAVLLGLLILSLVLSL